MKCFPGRQCFGEHFAIVIGKRRSVQPTQLCRAIGRRHRCRGRNCGAITGQAALVRITVAFDHFDAMRNRQRVFIVVVAGGIDNAVQPVVNLLMVFFEAIGSATPAAEFGKHVQDQKPADVGRRDIAALAEQW